MGVVIDANAFGRARWSWGGSCYAAFSSVPGAARGLSDARRQCPYDYGTAWARGWRLELGVRIGQTDDASGAVTYDRPVRSEIFVLALCATVACGETERANDQDAAAHTEGGGPVAGASGLSGAGGSTGGVGAFGGAGATGGSSGTDPGQDGGFDAETDGPSSGDAADSGDAGEVCLEACEMFTVLNCAGGPNTSADCIQACAALANKGAGCKAHTDEVYACMMAAGSQSVACGSYGAQPKCGFCDALVADLSKYCAFSSPCVP